MGDFKPKRKPCARCNGSGFVIEYRLPCGELGHTSNMFAKKCPECDGTGETLVFVEEDGGE